MKKIRWQLIIILLTGLIVGILLLGQQPIVGPLAPAPSSGGVYSEGLVGSLNRLNPLLDYYNQPDRDIDRLLYSGLVKFDPTGVAVPDLALSWGISKDAVLYNVSLREDAVWHDGTPVTSDDVIFTIDLMRHDSSKLPEDLKALWRQVEVKQLDKLTLQFKLPEPFAPFMDYLTFGILPKHLLGSVPPDQIVNAPFNLQPVGSGPYRFDHLITDNGNVKGIVLSASGSYYAKVPFIQQLIFRYYPDIAAVQNAYKQGEIQGMSDIPSESLPEVLDDPKLAVYTGRRPEMTLLLLNLNNPNVPFFQDKVVRKALLTGINRQWIVNRILKGQAIVADGPILPGTWAYYSGIEHVDFDPKVASALLKSVEYELPAEGGGVRAKEGQSLSFEMVYPDDQIHQAIAEQIQQDLLTIGVQVNIKAVPYPQLLQDYLGTRNYQAALVELNLARSPDPDPYPFWHQSQISGGQNYSQWDMRSASEYLEQARTLVEPDVRTRLYKNFQALFTREMPALPMYYPVYTYAVDRQIQGVQMGPLFDLTDRFATITDWYVVTKPGPSQETAIPEQTPATVQ